jgi:hypothetical protein
VDFVYEHKEKARAPRKNTGHQNPSFGSAIWLLANEARIKKGKFKAHVVKGLMNNSWSA